jgi:hypothetical protein
LILNLHHDERRHEWLTDILLVDLRDPAVASVLLVAVINVISAFVA